jgi:hypothetical protein
MKLSTEKKVFNENKQLLSEKIMTGKTDSPEPNKRRD